MICARLPAGFGDELDAGLAGACEVTIAGSATKSAHAKPHVRCFMLAAPHRPAAPENLVVDILSRTVDRCIVVQTSMTGPPDGRDGGGGASCCCLLRSATTSATHAVHVGSKSVTGRNSRTNVGS